MHGRIAVVAAMLLAGCGGVEERPEPVPMEIRATQTGSFSTAPQVSVPGMTGVSAVGSAPKPSGKPVWSRRRFRVSQLKALRAHCATRPKDDPRCDGARVNERVAFGEQG